MKFAIIIEKYPGGDIKTLRSTVVPMTSDLEKHARELDSYLSKRIPTIEKELIDSKLLNEKISTKGTRKNRGNVLLWHALGQKLSAICKEKDINTRRERRWLWEAIEKIHATERIKRAKRGHRHHFEHCYRLSKFPLKFAKQLNWAEWSYFFDLRTVREEQRVDNWLMTLVKRNEKVNRRLFRQFMVRLNKRVRKLDTSILSDSELFAIYDEEWESAKTT